MFDHGYEYEVKVKIGFSRDEFDHLKGMAEGHYDGRCRSMFAQGGTFWPWVYDTESPVDVVLTERELQTLIKISETEFLLGAGMSLYAELFKLLKHLHMRSRTCNTVGP